MLPPDSVIIPPTRLAEYYWVFGAPIAGGYLIAGDNLPPLPIDPTGAAPYFEYTMPTWMPRQIHIIEACVGYECSDVHNVDLMEIEFWVDPGGRSFWSTDPPGLEANFERILSIIQDAQYPLPREALIWSKNFSACPIVWDRDAGDLLVLKMACSREVPWVSVEIRWPIANTIPLPELGADYYVTSNASVEASEIARREMFAWNTRNRRR